MLSVDETKLKNYPSKIYRKMHKLIKTAPRGASEGLHLVKRLFSLFCSSTWRAFSNCVRILLYKEFNFDKTIKETQRG